QPVGLGLGDQRGDGLSRVVQRPRLRRPVGGGGAGRDEGGSTGRTAPGLVARVKCREKLAVGLLAAPCHQEPPRLAVACRRRPAGRLKQGGQVVITDLMAVIESAWAPPLREQRVNRNRGTSRLAHLTASFL